MKRYFNVKRRLGLGWACLVGAALLAACSSGGNTPTLPPGAAYPAGPAATAALPAGYPAQATPVLPTAAPAKAGYPAPATVAPPAGAEAVVALAKKDLAQSLNVSADQINLIAATAKEWPDASLGCPQPGKVYSQVLTPGFQLTLDYAQKQYFYHTDMQQQAVQCATP